MKVSEVSITLSGRNGYVCFVNSFLEFGEIATGRVFRGRCNFGHAGG